MTSTSELIARADQVKAECEVRENHPDDCCPDFTAMLRECEANLRLAANQAGSERAGVDALEIARAVRQRAANLASGYPKNDPEHLRWLHHSYGADEVAYQIDEALTTPPAQPAPAATHGDGYCGCTERCKDRDNCQYDVKPEDFNDQDEVLLAYGLLWCVDTSDKRVHSARRELLKCLNRELQAKAISAARTTMALVRDIRQMKGATFAADFDKPTHGNPDGAVRSDALADLYYAIGGLAALAAIGCDEVGRMTGDHVAVTQSMERRRDDALAALHSPKIAAAETSPGDAYRDAIDEALVVRHLGVAKGDARAELNQILDWDVAVALDPSVSERAQSLVNSGPGDVLAMKEAWRKFSGLMLVDGDPPSIVYPAEVDQNEWASAYDGLCAAIDRLDVKAEAKSQEPNAALTVPFNPCLAKLREGEPFFVLLGRDKQAPLAVVAWADARESAEGKSAWTDQAREVAASMADYSGAKFPTTKPEAPAVSVDAETIDAVARIIDPTAWKMEHGYWMEQAHAYEAISKATAIAALIAEGR